MSTPAKAPVATTWRDRGRSALVVAVIGLVPVAVAWLGSLLASDEVGACSGFCLADSSLWAAAALALLVLVAGPALLVGAPVAALTTRGRSAVGGVVFGLLATAGVGLPLGVLAAVMIWMS